jgi:hypothetical protein
MCKELYRSLETDLQNVVFYTTKANLLGSSEKSLIREGVTTVASIKENLQTIAQLKSLIAWLREAIKAKERLIEEANSSSYKDYGIECPEPPQRERYLTEDDVVSTWGIKQRNRYYYLESLCATIGSYIHPEGVYARERENLYKVLSEPNTIQGSGRDTVIYSKIPSISKTEVEDTFIELQAMYRSYQAELNSLKYSVESELNKDKTEKNLKYESELEEYKNSMSLINAQLKSKIHEAAIAAQNLKIIIPDSLKPIYDRIQQLGK